MSMIRSVTPMSSFVWFQRQKYFICTITPPLSVVINQLYMIQSLTFHVTSLYFVQSHWTILPPGLQPINPFRVTLTLLIHLRGLSLLHPGRLEVPFSEIRQVSRLRFRNLLIVFLQRFFVILRLLPVSTHSHLSFPPYLYCSCLRLPDHPSDTVPETKMRR